MRRSDLRDVSENLPAGGHLSTAADLVRFAQAFNSGKLVNIETVALMSKPLNISNKPDRESSWRDAIPSEPYYSYGMMFFQNEKTLWLGHDGQQAGGSSILILIPEQNLSIAVLTNIKGWRGYMSFTRRIAKIMETAAKH